MADSFLNIYNFINFNDYPEISLLGIKIEAIGVGPKLMRWVRTP
jgi:hypothetical protein